MNPSSALCDLCGLSLKYGTIKWISDGKPFSFCCIGCRQIFIMLMETADASDPSQFKETALFKKCVEMGIIPRSESDLRQRSLKTLPNDPRVIVRSAGKHAESSPSESPENTLSLHLKVVDMWCPACAWFIEQALERCAGVVQASCNFSTDRVYCEYNPIQTSPDRLMRSIDSLGYRSMLPEEDARSNETRKDFIRFVVSAFLTANVMMLSFSLYSGFFTQLTPDTVHKLSWPIFALAGIVLFYGGYRIYRKAWAGIISAAFGMETLITVGAFSAFIYSTVNLFSGSIHLYYDTASMLITLTLLGKTIERKAKDAVQLDLGNFFSLRPTKVKRLSPEFPDGRYMAAEMLCRGDLFKVEEGEIISADGLIVEGTGTIDESSLTGEALPVSKKAGNRVRSGTRMLQGSLKIKAEAVGPASTLGQMIRIMEKALGQKLPLEGKTDRILQWFVPGILLLATATGAGCLLWGLSFETAMIRTVTVMVISCPCALGIAIPLARVAGISLAANQGILVRDFSAFEQAQRTDTMVFDKTGTLTHGEWSLQHIIPLGAFDEKKILALAVALEKDSEHYIAMEIKRCANERAMHPATLRNIRYDQNGISGLLGADIIKIGSKGFIAEGMNDFSFMQNAVTEYETLQSKVYMSYAGQPCAVFVFGDTLRSTAHDTMETLRNLGYGLALVSGDGEKTTRTIGNMLGIQDAYGGKLPQDKALFVRDLQTKGKIVTMVGDGINDAPALAQADMAVAIHSGSHLGKETADITLMQGEPGKIIDYFKLARQVNAKIHQNLLLSLLYNTVSIPIAMSGWLTPIVAVCAMLLSSLSVIGNTLLLKHKFK